jgi:hypothetical protein
MDAAVLEVGEEVERLADPVRRETVLHGQGFVRAIYGIPTNVVTLCAASVSDTRELATVTPEP